MDFLPNKINRICKIRKISYKWPETCKSMLKMLTGQENNSINSLLKVSYF